MTDAPLPPKPPSPTVPPKPIVPPDPPADKPAVTETKVEAAGVVKPTMSTAVVGTAATGMSVAALEPVVDWGFTGFHMPPPPAVSFAAASLLMIMLHFTYAVFSKLGVKLGLIEQPSS